MNKSFPKKVLALTMCIAMTMSSFIYADNVIVGNAPGVGSNNKMQDINATTTYLQNQYSGPGLLPNSSITGNTPIQGANRTDTNGVSDTGPTTQTITSPRVGGSATDPASKNSISVISNGAFNTAVNNTSTADAGPVTREVLAPSAENAPIVSGDGSVSNNDNYSGPGYTAPSPVQQETVVQTDAVVNVSTANDGPIIYQQNNAIQAVKPNVVAPGALVVNATTRQIYFSKGGLTPFHPAAITNLVTAAVLLEHKGLEDRLVVTATALQGLESGANTVGLKAGDNISVKDAIGAMFTKSACDVANVVAENVAGNVANFVALMNQKAVSWGCVGTRFTNPTGLNNDAQVTTTYDAAIIMDKVSSSAILKYLMQQPVYAFPATAHSGAKALTTSNQLLIQGNKNYYPGVATRMGYTSKAKYTIVAELDYNGQRLIAVVLKADNSQYDDTKRLLNYAKVASLEGSARTGTVYNTTLGIANDQMAQIMDANAYLANQAALAAANQAAANQAAANQAALAAANQAAANQAALAAANQAALAAAAERVYNNAAAAAIANTSADTPGTWMRNDKGWYFIKPNGASATNEWIRQNNKIYCIDSNGYMITGWKQMSNGSTYYFDPTTGELRYNTWINVSTGAYYLQEDGTLAKAAPGTTGTIVTSVGTYTIDDTGRAIAKVSR